MEYENQKCQGHLRRPYRDPEPGDPAHTATSRRARDPDKSNAPMQLPAAATSMAPHTIRARGRHLSKPTHGEPSEPYRPPPEAMMAALTTRQRQIT